MNRPLQVVIVGGGTAGWMTAAAFAGVISPRQAEVRLIESDEIGTVGVGEATLPQIKEFNDRIGIDEAEFMRATNASFKLGIEFVDWGKRGNRYVHPFGAFGQPMGGVDFHQCWLRAQASGLDSPLEAFSYPIVASYAQKFDFPAKDQTSVAAAYAYAYHFDAFLYARFLRGFAEARGIVRKEGRIVDVALNPQNGHVQSVTLASGEMIEGDLFIDCSGFRSLLLGQALETPYEDWTPWLPCDRAVAVPCARNEAAFTPYTRSTAREAGWQWRIPLQHRTGNGYVYASSFISDDEAIRTLMDNLDGAPEAEPRPLKFKAGRREKCWNRNVIGVGLASGFLEPLESTSIYLIQIAVINLIRLLPRDGQIDPVIEAEFNRLVDLEYERIRDFLILHYKANTRDEPLWRQTRGMAVPDSLAARMERFRHRGLVPNYRDGLFAPPSWISVMFGQDLRPEGYDPLADNIDLERLIGRMRDMERQIHQHVEKMPSHADFVREFASAREVA